MSNNPVIKMVLFGEDADGAFEEEVELPAKYEVCPRCDGTGTHVNPSIDGNGLSSEDFDEAGPEFLEDYMGGVYDVQCYECDGLRVVLELDRARCKPDLLERYDKQQQDLAEMYAIEAAERRMGA